MSAVVFRNIEAERGRAGLSKVALCKKLDVTDTTYRKWLAGGANIPSNKLIAMGDLFEVSIDYLLDTKGIRPRASRSPSASQVQRGREEGLL